MTRRERARQATREAGTPDWGSDDQEQLEMAVEQAIIDATAEAEAQLAEANADAKRNIGVLQTQLTNCHETMRKDGVSHAKALLALEDDGRRIENLETDAARFLDILRDVWNQFATERPDGTKWHGGLSTLEDVEAALRTDEQPDCDHPFRVTGETCGACGAKDEQPAAFTFDLVAHLTRQRAFSLKTFGPGIRTKGVIEHIKKELVEIEAKPYDLKEWIDVVILAFDGAWRSGANPEEIARIFESKQTINEGREWPDWRTCDPNNAIEHVRDEQPAAK